MTIFLQHSVQAEHAYNAVVLASSIVLSKHADDSAQAAAKVCMTCITTSRHDASHLEKYGSLGSIHKHSLKAQPQEEHAQGHSLQPYLHRSSFLRSPGRRRAFTPASSTTFFASSASWCSSRYDMATFAPSRARCSAMARPIPESPPVTKAVFKHTQRQQRHLVLSNPKAMPNMLMMIYVIGATQWCSSGCLTVVSLTATSWADLLLGTLHWDA